MWWIAIVVGVPFFVLAIWIAVWPPLRNSMRYHRWEEHRAETGRLTRPVRMRTGCPLCEARFEANSAGEAVDLKNRHLLDEHARTREAADAEVTGTEADAARRPA